MSSAKMSSATSSTSPVAPNPSTPNPSTSTATASTSTLSSPNNTSTASPPLASTTTSLSSPPLAQNPLPNPAPGTQNARPHIQPTLPSADQERHVAEARSAIVASIENMLDSELQWRGAMLHSNAAALEKQERELVRATEALRRENDKLAKVASDTAKKLKEFGNVQNWAEVLEKDFLVLEETIRLKNEGSQSSLCSGSCCWSGSEDGDEREETEGGVDGEGDVKMEEGEGEDRRLPGHEGPDLYESSDLPEDDKQPLDKGKGKEEDMPAVMEVDGLHADMSEASQSIHDAESSYGTDSRAKGSETTSISAEV